MFVFLKPPDRTESEDLASALTSEVFLSEFLALNGKLFWTKSYFA